MKKGLLSILASALLVVGCQNYDDQFSALETQINALASTVAGLSQVQSDLSTLAATVNSLQSALSSQIDTALADGLADIDAAVADLEAATANAASAEDVQAITDAVADNQTSLEELLAQSSVYQGSITVNTVALLNVYHSIGDGLAIVNGSVTITNNAEMDNTKVQELINNILVTLEDFTYTAGTGVTDEMTFNNLSGTRSLTLDQKGGYVLQGLTSATNIILDDDATVDIVDLRALNSVISLKDDAAATAGTFTFSKALELHLTALPRSPSAALSLGVDEGGVIDITALTDADATGTATKLNLTLDGPDTITISALTGDKAGSTVSLTNVINATLNGYDGTVTIGEDVQNFTSDGLVAWNVAGNDLVTVNVTGILDPNAATADTKGPIVNLASQGDLTTVTTAGTYETVTLASNGNLVTATIGGTVTEAGGISITGNSDLTSLDLSGATTDKVNIDGNSDLEVLDVNFTAAKGAATTQEGTILVNNNESLTSLTIGTSNIDNLAITNNADLALINLAGMTAIGATGTASVTIVSNDLNASTSTDDEDGATAAADVADGAAGDLGSFVTASGMDTAKAYLTAVAADADSAARVTFDKVDSVVDSEGATDTEVSDQLNVAVLTLTAKNVTTAAIGAAKHKHALAINATGATRTINILVDGTAQLFSPSTISPQANAALFIAEIKSATNLTRAAAYDVTLDAHEGAYPTGKILIANAASLTDESYSLGANNGVVAFNVSATDIVNLTIDGVLLSGTLAALAADGAPDRGYTIASATSPNIATFRDIVAGAWTTKYGAGTGAIDSSAISLFEVSTGTAATISIKAKDRSGRRGYDKAYSLSITSASTTLSSAVYGLTYGATVDPSDNNTISNGIIVTVEDNIGGTLLDASSGLKFQFGGATISETSYVNIYTLLSTTALLNSNPTVDTTTATNIYPGDARGDAVNAEGQVSEVADAAVSFNRVTWL
jgi:PBP1b-binding outer membrane lipoprotein LpoB